ncbi:MAG: right-handed parallel beta-helix repeat-containing protein [Halobacteriales archaeon]|nr:right-handed parallel beta-helix repeat-containing protein [Halobacteriales archaeon]
MNASNVVLEGNDNTIDGVDNDATSIGVNVTASTTLSNVTVRNLTVQNWGQGVEYEDAVDGEISDVVATGNNAGVRLDTATGNDVTANNLSGNNFSGIDLRASSNSNNVTNNEVSGNFYGILIVLGSNNNLVRNSGEQQRRGRYTHRRRHGQRTDI